MPINVLSMFLERGFCDYDTTSGERGNYLWNETQVGVTIQQDCFYEPLNEMGFAFRYCIANELWNSTDASECVTENTYRLRLLSRVIIFAIIHWNTILH